MKGSTLIELMLALLLSVLILGSLITVYSAMQAVSRTQTALTAIHENGSMAHSLLSDDIKMAGYAGCAKLRKDYPVSYSEIFSLTNENKIQPYHGSAIKSGSTVLTIRHISDKSAMLIQPMRNYSLLSVSAEPRFLKGDLLNLSDCRQAELFRVKEVVRESNDTQKILADKPLHTLYGKNAEVSQFNINTYFIGKTARLSASGAAIYALYKQDIKLHRNELIEGVEDMKIKYTLLDKGQLYELAEEEVTDWSKVIGVSIMLTLADPAFSSIKKHEYIYATLRSL